MTENRKDYAEIVKKSVKTAIREETCKKEVIIAQAEEKGRDELLIDDPCEKLAFNSKPVDIARVGRKSNERKSETNGHDDATHHRLLKVTFANSFEARAFRARYEEKRKSNRNDIPALAASATRS